MRPGFATQCAYFICHLLGILRCPGNAHNVRAFGGKFQRDCPPYTSARTRYDSHLLLKLIHAADGLTTKYTKYTKKLFVKRHR
jgi:hypothetical protein